MKQDRLQTFRWSEQGFVFEIDSPDEKLLEKAHLVFGTHAVAAPDKANRSWKIEMIDEAGSQSWLVSGASSSSSMLPQRAESHDVALLIVEYDSLEWLVHNCDKSIVVHAALLSRDNKGALVVGPSLAGKSTLATALWRSGWTLMSDDLVFIDAAERVASPAPRRVSLRFGSRNLVGDTLWNAISATPSCLETAKGLFFHPHELSRTEKKRSTPLTAIFFLSRLGGQTGPAEIRSLNPAKGALSLLPYASNVRTLPFVEGLRRVTPLLNEVPAYDLGRGDLQSMIHAVEVTVGNA